MKPARLLMTCGEQQKVGGCRASRVCVCLSAQLLMTCGEQQKVGGCRASRVCVCLSARLLMTCGEQQKVGGCMASRVCVCGCVCVPVCAGVLRTYAVPSLCAPYKGNLSARRCALRVRMCAACACALCVPVPFESRVHIAVGPCQVRWSLALRIGQLRRQCPACP